MTSYFDHFVVTQVFTNYVTDGFIVLLCVVLLYIVINSSVSVIPNRYQGSFEVVLEHWRKIVIDNLGLSKQLFLIPLLGLFLFILGVNLLGFFTYTFPVTTHIFLTFGIAFSIWIGVMLFGLLNFRLSFFSMFMPSGAPIAMSPLLVIIELASNVSRPISLGMRLAANLTAGHILMAILGDFGYKLLIVSYGLSAMFPLLIVIFMTALEIGVLVIQAYVFCLLSVVYLKDSLVLH